MTLLSRRTLRQKRSEFRSPSFRPASGTSCVSFPEVLRASETLAGVAPAVVPLASEIGPVRQRATTE